MLAVPALAVAGNWPLAAALIVLERVGRATRTPPRDVMLAQAGESMGRGWAFGLNEALDQLGAMIGPLIIAAALAWRQDFQVAFALLALHPERGIRRTVHLPECRPRCASVADR